MTENFKTLYKKNTKGGFQEWTVSVDGSTITTRFGQHGGSIQTTSDTVLEGKNIGKTNETTPEQQAVAEAKSLYEKKLKSGYVDSLEKADKGEVDSIIKGGVLPMLAHKYKDHSSKISFPCAVQPKLDGIRCVALKENGEFTLWTRTRKKINSVPHIVEALNRCFKTFPEGSALDGELWHPDSNSKDYRCIEGVFIDKEDEYLLGGYNLYVDANGYAQVTNANRKPKYVHRLVMGNPQGHVDHINGNKLDNRKANLRLCNPSDNLGNTSKRPQNTTGFKGVMYFKRDGNYHAQITKDYKKIHIGYFNTPEEAALAYDDKAVELFGEFARVNFPKKIEVKEAYNFEKIVSAVRKDEPSEESTKIQYHIYDCVMDGTFQERLFVLQTFDLTSAEGTLARVDTALVPVEEEVGYWESVALDSGYEGCMVRNIHSVYENKRSYNLQKVVNEDSMEATVTGFKEGRGKLTGLVGAFELVTQDGVEFESSPMGTHESTRKFVENPELCIGKTATIKFRGYTKDGKPRFGKLVTIRDYE